jgi:anthranilate phosphoribosyltransferase
VLSELGSDHVFVLHGMDGMDEFTLTAETLVCEIREGRRRTKLLAPEDLGLARFRSLEFLGGDATQNASIIHEVLSGAGGPKADICVANAAFAIVVAGRAVDLKEGVRLARDAIESGAARRKLDALVEFSCPGGAGDVPR